MSSSEPYGRRRWREETRGEGEGASVPGSEDTSFRSHPAPVVSCGAGQAEVPAGSRRQCPGRHYRKLRAGAAEQALSKHKGGHRDRSASPTTPALPCWEGLRQLLFPQAAPSHPTTLLLSCLRPAPCSLLLAWCGWQDPVSRWLSARPRAWGSLEGGGREACPAWVLHQAGPAGGSRG